MSGAPNPAPPKEPPLRGAEEQHPAGAPCGARSEVLPLLDTTAGFTTEGSGFPWSSFRLTRVSGCRWPDVQATGIQGLSAPGNCAAHGSSAGRSGII
jgi:hypothetical protein